MNLLQQGEPAQLMITSLYDLPSTQSYMNTQGSPDTGRNVRRESSDIYWVAWVNGTSSSPTEGINSFPLENYWNGSYGYTFSVDFPGNYCVAVYK